MRPRLQDLLATTPHLLERLPQILAHPEPGSLTERVGIRCVRELGYDLRGPYAAAIIALTTALHDLNFTLEAASEGPEHAYLRVALPADAALPAGALEFQVQEYAPQFTRVQARAVLPGVLTDHGRGLRALRDIECAAQSRLTLQVKSA